MLRRSAWPNTRHDLEDTSRVSTDDDNGYEFELLLNYGNPGRKRRSSRQRKEGDDTLFDAQSRKNMRLKINMTK